MKLNPFHLAFPVKDLASTRAFYGTLLGCREGRSSAVWVDFDFFGHQITAHIRPGDALLSHNQVDGKAVPVPHFGAILDWPDFHALAARLARAGATFFHEPQIRFKGLTGEQATLFIADPSGNMLEFKSFKNPEMLFAKTPEESYT